MNIAWESPVEAAATIALGIFSVGICLCAARLARGPSLPDRIVALDTISILIVGLFVCFGVAEDQPESLRVATVLALIAFVGTVGFAVYIRWRAGG